MATYKVLQDIEAEDKLLGPLTLKQFIYAIITILLGFLAYVFSKINVFLMIPWFIPMSFFGFMAAPISKDQPNDVWLAARLRFLIKPRKRVWDQSGMQELVTINAPKKMEIQRTDGLSQGEVRSRLSALTSVMDTRGWAVKNLDSNPERPSPQNTSNLNGDRLFEIAGPDVDTSSSLPPAEDMLDPMNNMIAQRFDSAIKKQQADKINSLKEALINKSSPERAPSEHSASGGNDYDFITQDKQQMNPGYSRFGAQVVKPKDEGYPEDPLSTTAFTEPDISSGDEKALLEKIHHTQAIKKQIENSSREHRIDPMNESQKNQPFRQEHTTNQPAPDAILKQLGQTNDLSVSSLASLAKHAGNESSLQDNDVVSFH